MKNTMRILSSIGAVAGALCVAPVLADTGSDWFDTETAQLGQELAARNRLDDELVQYQLAQGYAVPEVVRRESDMRALASDDAFTREMATLHDTLALYALIDQNH
jgi:hypothetical protein